VTIFRVWAPRPGRVELDLDGRRVGIEFTTRLRGMIKFDDAAALIAQMKQDVAKARAILLAGQP
jgi:riboflavin kinase/FMN adenylyltransferase